MSITRYLFASSMAASLTVCSQTSMQGPSLGYAYDGQMKGARPMVGILGSAIFGQPVPLPLREPKLAATQDLWIGEDAEGKIAISRVSTGEQVRLSEENAPVRWALSPNGSAAIVSFAEKIEVYKGLSGVPERSLSAAFATGKVKLLAVADDASTAAAVIDEGESSAVYRISDGASERVWAADVKGIAFIGKRNDLAVIAAEGLSVLERAFDVKPVSAEVRGIAVASDTAGDQLFIASPEERAVYQVTLGSGAVKKLDCVCKPAMLERLAGKAVFRLNELTDEPVWVLDATGSQPRVAFVPFGGSNE